MSTRERFRSVRWLVPGILAGIGLMVCTGCPGLGGASTNAALQQLLEDLQIGQDANAVTIRIVNGSAGLTEELDLRIDGVLQTFTCEADAGTCNFSLGYVPSRIEGVEERRLDEEDVYQGGRILDGNAKFIFTEDYFGPGSVIVFQLSEEQAEPSVI